MSEEQETLLSGSPPLWLNEFGHILGYGNYTQDVRLHYDDSRTTRIKDPAIYASNIYYPCTEILGRWVTHIDGVHGVPEIDLTPYKYVGKPRMGMDV